MNSRSALESLSLSKPRPVPDTQLHAPWRLFVQGFCAAVALLALTMFVAGTAANYGFWQVACDGSACVAGQVGPVGEEALQALGLSLHFYALYLVTLSSILAFFFGASALVIVLRKRDDWLALFVAVMLVTFGTVTFSDSMQGITTIYPSLWLAAHFIGWFGDMAIMTFFFIFPTGQFVPRWTIVVLLLWGAMQGFRFFWPDSAFNLQLSAPVLYTILFPLGVACGLFAQIYRYRRVSAPAQRQQTKWVVYSVALAMGVFLLVALLFRDLQTEDHIILLLAVATVQVLFILLLPLSIAIAVLRYRLWEIDPIINRTLVYSGLTVSVIALYILLVGALGLLFQGQGNFVISVLATGVAAFLFEPIRRRLQRAVNRLMYGERDNPYEVLTRLMQRLQNSVAPEATLSLLTETVSQTLKLPYVALTSKQAPEHAGEQQGEEPVFEVVASSGVAMDNLLALPLVYQAKVIGQLLVARRAAGESFTPGEERLLAEIAQQAGIALNAGRLTRDLQRSRERLITAREEERRRLRRDLHDGLGPALANLTLQIETAHDFLTSNPARADALLEDLTVQAQAAITDIRRLVYDLRPPALDEFGLIFALREQAAQYEHTGLQTTVIAPEPLPALPAAVEVAAYRIAQEALTNVARHAQARTCVIRLEIDQQLRLEISDDGRGISSTRRSGVGLASMRERADELGGACLIETMPDGGTRVVVTLPLGSSAGGEVL